MSADNDRIFVSWTQEWDLERYIEKYLSSRRLSSAARQFVYDHIATYSGNRPFTGRSTDQGAATPRPIPRKDARPDATH